MDKITKWWCRLTVRWWTPGSSTSKAPPFLLTSEISRGTKPTPSSVPLQQPRRQRTLSAPSPSHYSSARGCTGKLRVGPCLTAAQVRDAAFCPLAASTAPQQNQGTERKKEAALFSTICPPTWKALKSDTRGTAFLQRQIRPCTLERCLVWIFFCTFLNLFPLCFCV